MREKYTIFRIPQVFHFPISRFRQPIFWSSRPNSNLVVKKMIIGLLNLIETEVNIVKLDKFNLSTRTNNFHTLQRVHNSRLGANI